MKKIGVYGGTFDPIHFGHLNLAFELMEKGGLDEVWFVPAHISPHKTDQQPPIAFMHRFAMLDRVMADIPPFHVIDIEGRRPPPSYTLHTLQEFMIAEAKQSSSSQFYLLLGEDAIPRFFQWYQPEEIVKLVPLLIGSRTGYWQSEENASYDLTIREAIQKGFIQTRIMDISSTELRNRLSKNLYCNHLIPAKALDYIDQNQLYKSNY